MSFLIWLDDLKWPQMTLKWPQMGFFIWSDDLKWPTNFIFSLDPVQLVNFMITEKPKKPVVCEGVKGFEKVEIADGEFICLHL